jgi:hypothetical protein
MPGPPAAGRRRGDGGLVIFRPEHTETQVTWGGGMTAPVAACARVPRDTIDWINMQATRVLEFRGRLMAGALTT